LFTKHILLDHTITTYEMGPFFDNGCEQHNSYYCLRCTTPTTLDPSPPSAYVSEYLQDHQAPPVNTYLEDPPAYVPAYLQDPQAPSVNPYLEDPTLRWDWNPFPPPEPQEVMRGVDLDADWDAVSVDDSAAQLPARVKPEEPAPPQRKNGRFGPRGPYKKRQKANVEPKNAAGPANAPKDSTGKDTLRKKGVGSVGRSKMEGDIRPTETSKDSGQRSEMQRQGFNTTADSSLSSTLRAPAKPSIHLFKTVEKRQVVPEPMSAEILTRPTVEPSKLSFEEVEMGQSGPVPHTKSGLKVTNTTERPNTMPPSMDVMEGGSKGEQEPIEPPATANFTTDGDMTESEEESVPSSKLKRHTGLTLKLSRKVGPEQEPPPVPEPKSTESPQRPAMKSPKLPAPMPTQMETRPSSFRGDAAKKLWNVERLLGMKVDKDGAEKFKVAWAGAEFGNTWEPAANLARGLDAEMAKHRSAYYAKHDGTYGGDEDDNSTNTNAKNILKREHDNSEQDSDDKVNSKKARLSSATRKSSRSSLD
jgi:hypothetical protein